MAKNEESVVAGISETVVAALDECHFAVGARNPRPVVRVVSTVRFFTLALTVVLVGSFAGCNTFERRAEEHSGVFASLDAATRDRLRNRDLNVGYTLDMVYIAMGAPDERRVRHSADGSETTWIYNAYWQEYQGQALVGYRRYVVRDSLTGRYQVVYEPAREGVFAPREEERIRVTFRNDRVVAIEQAQ